MTVTDQEYALLAADVYEKRDDPNNDHSVDDDLSFSNGVLGWVSAAESNQGGFTDQNLIDAYNDANGTELDQIPFKALWGDGLFVDTYQKGDELVIAFRGHR